MRRTCLIISLIISLALLAACGRRDPVPLSVLDLEPCAGWGSAVPATERQFARAAAELSGRLCANAKLAAARGAITKGKEKS